MGSILFFVGANAQKIFDVHIHGDKDPSKQLAELVSNGVYKAAISTSWDLQTNYKTTADLIVLQGLLWLVLRVKFRIVCNTVFPIKRIS